MSLKHAFQPKAFLIAIGFACLLYALMVVLSVLNGADMIERIEAKMASQDIAFEKPVVLAEKFSPVEESGSSISENIGAEDVPEKLSSLNEPLPPAPYEGLTEEGSFGVLPIIGKNKLTPFKAYQKPFVSDISKPSIALGVKGVGLSKSLYEGIYDQLVPQVSLILSPYADGVDAIQKTAREKGYETWMILPLENKAFPYSDPGPVGILANSGLKFNQDNYRRILSSTSGYAGIAAYSDSAFLDAQTMLSGILSDAMIRGLGFFEMNSSRDAMSVKIAASNRAPYVAASLKERDVSLSKTFSDLKKQAKQQRKSVGVIDVTPAMLSSFKTEIAKAQDEGFEIVPLSAVADQY